MSSFHDVKSIVEALRKENLADYAKKVDDALRGGSTGSEIWGGVRYHLLKIPSKAMSPATLEKVNQIIGAIDRFLPR